MIFFMVETKRLPKDGFRNRARKPSLHPACEPKKQPALSPSEEKTGLNSYRCIFLRNSALHEVKRR